LAANLPRKVWPRKTAGQNDNVSLSELESAMRIRTVVLSFVTTAAIIGASAASAKDKASESFLKKAIEGNYSEVKMGELAQKNGQSDGVKSFGKMLSTDHTAANEKAMDAAKTMGMTSPSGPNTKQKADYDKMAKMASAQFDKMFAKHMVADHKKDIAEYKKEAKMKDAAGEYAGGQIDTLQKHLDTAKSLETAK
jgi:putative membrane protein